MSTYIHPTAEVHPSTEIGDGTKIWHFCHVRENSKIGKSCTIGKGVYVDMRVSIGDRVKIQNGVSVYHGVDIEDDVFVGPNATFTNDLYPRANCTDWKIVPTRLRKGCSIGANATIVCGVTIGAYAMVGAGSLVSANVPPFALITGNPSRIVGFVCRKGHKMSQNDIPGEGARYRCEACDEELNLTISAEVVEPASV